MEQSIQLRQLRKGPWLATLVVAAIAAVVAAVFYFLDPAQVHVFPTCYFHAVTGLDCPGCGGQRAFHQLLHGQIVAAFRLNALLFVVLPLAGWFLLREFVREATGRTWPSGFSRPVWVWLFVAVVVIFSVVRNLPFAPFNYLRA